MTRHCRSCTWSIARDGSGVLWCRLLNIRAGEPCKGWAYEPGTDHENETPAVARRGL